MVLEFEELREFTDDALIELERRILRANAEGALEDLAKELKIDFLLKNHEIVYGLYDPYKAKIMIIAFEIPNKDKILLSIKKMFGIPNERIEFVEFKKNFNYRSLKYTSKYSDIFVGPIPHKGNGIEDNSSFLAEVENNKSAYPSVQRLINSNGELKVCLNSIMDCIEKSEFIRNCKF